MGYFDYLEAKVETQKENKVYDYLAKNSFWFSLSAYGLFIVSIIIYIFVPLGTIVWTGACPIVGLGLGITGLVIGQKCKIILKKNHVKHPFTNMSVALNLLASFVCLIIFAVNLFLWI